MLKTSMEGCDSLYLLCLPLKGPTPFRCHDSRAGAFREQAISKPQQHVTSPSNERHSLIFYFGLTETRTNKDKQAPFEGSSLYLDPLDPNVCVGDTDIQGHYRDTVQCWLTAPSQNNYFKPFKPWVCLHFFKPKTYFKMRPELSPIFFSLP